MPQPTILTRQVIDVTERYIRSELGDAKKYSNREILDESGICSLHQLAAEIYALGYEDGDRAQASRAYARDGRLRDHITDFRQAVESLIRDEDGDLPDESFGGMVGQIRRVLEAEGKQ